MTDWEAQSCHSWPASASRPASLLQSSLDHVQLLCSHVGNNSRVKLLFCLIFLANLHIQAIFCLLPLFAIPFCQGTVLFSASGQRTNLSCYNYSMFYTCLHIIHPPAPLVSALKLDISLQKSWNSETRNSKFLPPDCHGRNTIKLLSCPQQSGDLCSS